jgi:signal transduction histidine kinase
LSIFDLRTEVSPTASLGAVLSDHVRLIGSRSGMTVHLSLAEGTKRLPVQTETEILRIAQEAITNARKHSGARNLHVSLAVEAPHARLVVADDGRGLVIARDDSFGMRTMRERADRVGATLRVRDKVSGSSGVEVILILEDRRKQPRLSTQHSLDYIA